MGGKSAPDNLQHGYETQVWLASSDEPAANQSGRYLHHKLTAEYLKQSDDPAVQDRFLKSCAAITGIDFPV